MSDLSRLQDAIEEKVAGPAHLPHLGSRPGWSPDREGQIPALCTVCGLPPPEDIPEAASIAPDPIVHGELATYVCLGCGFTRSRISWGGLQKPSQAVLDDYETEDRDIYPRPCGRPREAQRPTPVDPKKSGLAGGLGKSPLGSPSLRTGSGLKR